jgi:DNA mismatch repair protein MutS
MPPAPPDSFSDQTHDAPLEPASQAVAIAADASPMVAQFLAVKRAHPDCLLFYRMGDFYELFFDDAVIAAAALDITLTRRGRYAGAEIPMCGVPVHSHETYLARLIRQGHKVAVCEQMENPAEARRRGAKSVVERAVIRVITAGTLTEESLLDAKSHNYLAALAEAEGAMGLAWLDISTGEFETQSVALTSVAAALARLDAGELLVSERIVKHPALFETFRDLGGAVTPLPAARFDSRNARLRLEALYGVKALDGFGAFSRAELAAAGALVDYVELTQKGKLPALLPPKRWDAGAFMEIDQATRRNLELVATLSGEVKGSLLSVIDRTSTGAGARLLTEHLAAPLTDPAAISARLDKVQFFADGHGMREQVRGLLARCPDIERAQSRLSLNRGGPRDLAAIRDALGQVPALRLALSEGALAAPPPGIANAASELGEHGILVERLTRALEPDPPPALSDGGFIAAGYHSGLDEQRQLRDESRRLIAGLQARYAEMSGVPSLKIKHNNVLGYHIEVPPKQADRMGEPFIHRQTIASSVRFTTVELGELEGRIRGAADKALALEMQLFEDLAGEIAARSADIALAARALAALDVASALAELAIQRRYVRPVIEDGTGFAIEGGRHPVVEALMDTPFVANDCDLGGQQRLWLITGPNMAGKSTFLRQNALIAILAQMGSFVPATSARIGVVDRLFSRVGAADDLARGRSTFMVEMVEAAVILNQAGPRALVILDEIGRGTATFDGLSIAWATIEHLHEVNRCRALFATHYHELTALAAKLPALSCHAMRVKEWRNDVVFLHEIGPGSADRSYGIHVARLAGLPSAVIHRAEEVLAVLESGEQAASLSRLADDLPLFAQARRPAAAAPAGPSPLEQAVSAINPDDLTPKEALDALYRLKDVLGGKAP